MRSVFALAFLALMSAAACLAQAAEKQACNVNIDIIDTDPTGANVRVSPGRAAIASLKNPTQDGWIEVHVIGLLGDWYKIDRANLIDNALPSGGKMTSWAKDTCTKVSWASAACRMAAQSISIMTAEMARLIFTPPAISGWTC
jgi:hypothetical protein